MVFLLALSRLREVMGESRAMWGRRLTSRALHWWQEQMWDLQLPCFPIMPLLPRAYRVWAEWNTLDCAGSGAEKREQLLVSLENHSAQGVCLKLWCAGTCSVYSSPQSPLALKNKYFIVLQAFSTADIPQLVCQSAGANHLLMCFHLERLHKTLEGINLSYILQTRQFQWPAAASRSVKFASTGRKKIHLLFTDLHTEKDSVWIRRLYIFEYMFASSELEESRKGVLWPWLVILTLTLNQDSYCANLD